MKKTFEVQMEIDESYLTDLLSTARSDVCGVQWWDYDDDEYEEAREQLVKEGNAKPYLEEVWARMLMIGKKLRLLDPESDWHWSGHEPGELLWNAQIVAEGCVPEGGDWHPLGLEDVVNGIQMYGKARIAGDCGGDIVKIVENGDFWDADAVIQYAIYGDCIYG